MNEGIIEKKLITEYRKISELKEEKENLKEYYELLKSRREEILALRRIKNNEKRNNAIELKKANQELVSLVFQDGLIRKDKNDKSVSHLGLHQYRDEFFPENNFSTPERSPLNRRQYVREDLEITLPSDFTRRNAPAFTYRDGNDIQRNINRSTPVNNSGFENNMTKSIPEIVEPTLKLKPNKPIEPNKVVESKNEQKQEPLVIKPIDEPKKEFNFRFDIENIEETKSIDLKTTDSKVELEKQPSKIVEEPKVAPPIIIQQQVEQQSANLTKAAYETNDTATIRPDPAIVLDPFDSLKSDKQISEEINLSIPKNSIPFTISIILLSVILITLFFVIIIWGFASGWTLDPNNFIDSLKSFFWIK